MPPKVNRIGRELRREKGVEKTTAASRSSQGYATDLTTAEQPQAHFYNRVLLP